MSRMAMPGHKSRPQTTYKGTVLSAPRNCMPLVLTVLVDTTGVSSHLSTGRREQEPQKHGERESQSACVKLLNTREGDMPKPGPRQRIPSPTFLFFFFYFCFSLHFGTLTPTSPPHVSGSSEGIPPFSDEMSHDTGMSTSQKEREKKTKTPHGQRERDRQEVKGRGNTKLF